MSARALASSFVEANCDPPGAGTPPAGRRLRSGVNGLRDMSDGSFTDCGADGHEEKTGLRRMGAREQWHPAMSRLTNVYTSHVRFGEATELYALDETILNPRGPRDGPPTGLDVDGHPTGQSAKRRELSSTELLSQYNQLAPGGEYKIQPALKTALAPGSAVPGAKAPSSSYEQQRSSVDCLNLPARAPPDRAGAQGTCLSGPGAIITDLADEGKPEGGQLGLQIKAGDGSSVSGMPRLLKHPEGFDRYGDNF